MTRSVEDSKALLPKELNATAWLQQNAQGAWFAAVKVHGHVDLIPISDGLAACLRDRWEVAS